MTPDQYINKAIHAINTGQPNLAMLYMKRGSEVSKKSRWDAMMATPPWGAVRVAAEQLGEAIGVLGDTFRGMIPVFDSLGEKFQSDFALVPAAKCCDPWLGDDCPCSCHAYKGATLDANL